MNLQKAIDQEDRAWRKYQLDIQNKYYWRQWLKKDSQLSKALSFHSGNPTQQLCIAAEVIKEDDGK